MFGNKYTICVWTQIFPNIHDWNLLVEFLGKYAFSKLEKEIDPQNGEYVFSHLFSQKVPLLTITHGLKSFMKVRGFDKETQSQHGTKNIQYWTRWGDWEEQLHFTHIPSNSRQHTQCHRRSSWPGISPMDECECVSVWVSSWLSQLCRMLSVTPTSFSTHTENCPRGRVILDSLPVPRDLFWCHHELRKCGT